MTPARRWLWTVLLASAYWLLPAAAGPAPSDPPEIIIQRTVDQAFAVLRDKSLSGREQRAQRLAALRQVADRTFDWGEMARSSLGVHWRSLDSGQRKRFVNVFKDILATEYMDDIDRFRGTETVTVDGKQTQGEDVVVRTTLITHSRDRIPINYRMRQEQDTWMVVDISIEDVSLVNHFRRSFSNALANMTVEELITRLSQQTVQRAPVPR